MADLTPQEALEQFERTTGFRIHAVTEPGGTMWWRRGERPLFECTIGDRCMHIDELSAPEPYGPRNPQCPAEDPAGLDCSGPAGHHGDHANINGPWAPPPVQDGTDG